MDLRRCADCNRIKIADFIEHQLDRGKIRNTVQLRIPAGAGDELEFRIGAYGWDMLVPCNLAQADETHSNGHHAIPSRRNASDLRSKPAPISLFGRGRYRIGSDRLFERGAFRTSRLAKRLERLQLILCRTSLALEKVELAKIFVEELVVRRNRQAFAVRVEGRVVFRC